MTYRTLAELRSELLSRVGMGAQGASGAAQPLLNSFLRNGQQQLYWLQDWKHLITYEDKTLGVDQNLLDYPDECARDKRVLRLETVYGGQWRVIPERIATENWDHMDVPGFPLRYDRYAQVLIYPKADQVYTVRFWYVKDMARFTQDGDRADLDDDMILLHALTNAKAHYRHPDASLYQGQLDSLLARLRGMSFTRQGVVTRRETVDLERKPAVVGRDV
jgi:hypothetical protein